MEEYHLPPNRLNCRHRIVPMHHPMCPILPINQSNLLLIKTHISLKLSILYMFLFLMLTTAQPIRSLITEIFLFLATLLINPMSTHVFQYQFQYFSNSCKVIQSLANLFYLLSFYAASVRAYFVGVISLLVSMLFFFFCFSCF